MSASTKACKDCGSTTRELKHPGPRCATCHRAKTKQRKSSAHDAYVCRTYGLRPGEYEKVKAMQGGKCFICQRATGASRALSVDHDHACCPEAPTCGKCDRALVCRPCNDALGHWNSVEKLWRAVAVIAYHPMQKMLAKIREEA